jgi:hypothetical protein
MKKKEYFVTEEICDLFLESRSAMLCRDKAINSIWGTKRAIQYGKIYIQKEQQAWNLVYELYPGLLGCELEYVYKTKEVKRKEKFD